MKRITATEAARRFSDLLDAVDGERESFVVVRRGREVATISPASPATGGRLKALLAEHRPDPAWAGELGELRGALVDDSQRWND
jgi:prevent-host-death family protein